MEDVYLRAVKNVLKDHRLINTAIALK